LAARALAVNLSDLAAMGAAPRAYFLSLGLPKDGGVDEGWLAAFADGLSAMQARHGVTLAGGDTVAVPGVLMITVTALGSVLAGQAIRRKGARPGDLVCVSGTIGDAALGLRVRKGGLSGLGRDHRAFLRARFDEPQPRVALGAALSGLASAGLDISDGLAADLGHLCRHSHVVATVRIDSIPLSDAARAAVGAEHGLWGPCVLGGGDDYELVFAVPPDRLAQAHTAGERAGTPVSVIGEFSAGEPGVHFVDGDGNAVVPPHAGYRHF
jgi:thiamine-monophosphate kinase